MMHDYLPDEFARSRWLFVRDSQCLQVVRWCDLTVVVDGPCCSFGRYRFKDEQQVQTFQVALAEHLTERGWLLCLSTSS